MNDSQIQTWIDKKVFPQRVLLSGTGNLYQQALEIAAKLQQSTPEAILRGLQGDTLLLSDEGESFKIGGDMQASPDTARGMITWSFQKPVSPYRIVILENFERASRDAPQALLKVIEEPPEKAIFIFTTRNHHQILDTILSRMTVISMSNKDLDFEIQPEIKQFLESSNLIFKFQYIDHIQKSAKEGEKKKALSDFCTQLLLHARFFEPYHVHLESIFEAQQALERNQNGKLILENLALTCTKS